MKDIDNKTYNYTYDRLNRLISVVSQNSTRSYSYDMAGNRTSVVNKISDVEPPSAVIYTFDANNRLTAEDTSPTITARITYKYDNNGNRVMKKKGANTTYYSYDFEGRMTGTAAGSTVTSYSYDGDGNRISKTTGGQTTTYT